ncbi:hypothetical protein Ccar_06325 [Clostridium carboxidivorans P7]|uniref:Integral membrane protein n=1 Tax=Clostridium carboxidivorans P7 TaxID=536227 RepID=C6PQE7_9CLOT|nr:DUF975 family protein [Clostridium carboxidivorans]AKN30459.1 hypothetical protein Ccar_06325 [Clostridium carboxidivorans P7]EET88469.1 protein of unknown function DUF975 [Clostridium carboxidivorans P7]EFG86200.1 hypothetical protein CLCAR_4019 [Clostridium carboxidivorans P7]
MTVDNYIFKNSKELRELAREKLKENWLKAMLVCFICWFVADSFSNISNVNDGIQHISFLNNHIHLNFMDNSSTDNILTFVSFLFSGALYAGSSLFFLKLIRNQNALVEDLLYGFKSFNLFGKLFLLELIKSLFIILWTLLLIVPGIIASLKYSMAYYIIIDNPDLSVTDAIDLSTKMMDGHKSRLFCLVLSFFGWFLLGILTLGIGFIWISPYYETSKANFYEELKQAYID